MTRTYGLQKFEWSIRALAQDAATQLKLYPSFAVVADELALEFEEHHRQLDLDVLRPAQSQAVQALSDALDQMSGPDHLRLWETEALDCAPEWQRIRELARDVLRVMGWPATPPPLERGAIYVGPGA